LTEPGPSVGPLILEALNIIEGWDVRSLGWNSPAYIDRLARALYVAFTDRTTALGDPGFVDVSVERVISKEYAAEQRRAIDSAAGHASGTDSRPWQGAEGTSHVSVFDSERNGAAITHSIGSASGVVTPGLGFLHNSHMAMFDPAPGTRNGVAPRKLPITGGGPTLFLQSGHPHLLVGSPAGSRKVSAIIQGFLNWTAFGMSLDDAVAAPRIHAEVDPATVVVEPFFPAELLRALASLGHRVRYEWYTARLAAVGDDPDVGLIGASDPRGDRGVMVVT
jgi:gamma-glutamyltranspeptidase/glutathione hydrolase